MGITYYEARSLWEARLAGKSFERMAMIAHQRVYLHPAELETLRTDIRKREKSGNPTPLSDYKFGEYIDRFCRELLGVNRLDIIDYSPYEGATIVHDMNQPIPDNMKDCFDLVLEGGSLEHIFAFPVAMGNLMQMVKTGGTMFLTTPANNLCGHGFYQFSPELMFRVFCPENGFEAPSVMFLEASFPSVELTPARGLFQVTDPAAVGGRVALRSSRPVMMMVQAKKIKHVKPFQTPPLQSDYVALWNEGDPSGGTTEKQNWMGKDTLKRLIQSMPDSWRNRISGYRENLECSLRNKRFYRNLNG